MTKQLAAHSGEKIKQGWTVGYFTGIITFYELLLNVQKCIWTENTGSRVALNN
jgi:hypothetical protein